MHLVVFSTLFSLAIAMPGWGAGRLQPRQVPSSGLPLSADEFNVGPILNLGFDPVDQFVDVRPGSGHEFIAPNPTDQRGPCPGLNAAANHGFLPRNGISTIPQAMLGLYKAFGFGLDSGASLAAVSVLLSGDVTTGTFSIGGPYAPGPLGGLLGGLLGGILSEPDGISYDHNGVESDASVARSDAYMNNGDAHSVDIARFDWLYSSAQDNYSPDVLRDHNNYVQQYSIQNNPYFFFAPVSGIVSLGAHILVPAIFSNYSAEHPQGYLNRENLKSFFGVSGSDNAHVANRGYDQIPLNWYRRPSSNPYTLAHVVADFGITLTKYPNLFSFGGNTGTVNSFVGLDIANLTGGVYDAQTLLQGNNLACFLFQAAQIGTPSQLKGPLGLIPAALSIVTQYLTPVLNQLACPALTTLNVGGFTRFPGYNYNPHP